MEKILYDSRGSTDKYNHMSSISEYDFVTSEVTELDQLLGTIPAARVLDRFGLESRLAKAKSESAIPPLPTPDPFDVRTRLNELSRLEDGWLDGEGKAPPPDGLQWLAECFDRYFLGELQLPSLCATEDGEIYAEWVLDPLNLSLEINLENHRGYWHATNFTDGSFTEKDIDLNQPDSWNWLCEQLKRNGGVA